MPLVAVLTWMWSGLTDFRITTMYPFVDALLYEIFRMLELLDNEVRFGYTPAFDAARLTYARSGTRLDCRQCPRSSRRDPVPRCCC